MIGTAQYVFLQHISPTLGLLIIHCCILQCGFFEGAESNLNKLAKVLVIWFSKLENDILLSPFFVLFFFSDSDSEGRQ